jgi:hypothetical protein
MKRIPLIAEFLNSRPLGATGNEVAAYFDIDVENAIKTLMLMVKRGQVERMGDGMRPDATYRLIHVVETPPIFRALQTLAAMRSVSMARLA